MENVKYTKTKYEYTIYSHLGTIEEKEISKEDLDKILKKHEDALKLCKQWTTEYEDSRVIAKFYHFYGYDDLYSLYIWETQYN